MITVQTLLSDNTQFAVQTLLSDNIQFAVQTLLSDNTYFAVQTLLSDNTQFAVQTLLGDNTQFAVLTLLSDNTQFAVQTLLGDNTQFAVQTLLGDNTQFAVQKFKRLQAYPFCNFYICDGSNGIPFSKIVSRRPIRIDVTARVRQNVCLTTRTCLFLDGRQCIQMEFLQSTWVQISVESSIVKSTMFLLNTDKCFTRLVTVYIVVLKHICLKYFVSQCVYVNVCSFLFGRLCTVCMILSVGTSFLPLQTIALYTKPATYVYLLKGSN